MRFARGTRHQGRQATQQLQPGEEEVRGAVRQRSLHAFRLELPHPATGQPVRVEAPLPEDFQRALTVLGKR